jgi:formylglycine-generating enzyme required for sulfatase activity
MKLLRITATAAALLLAGGSYTWGASGASGASGVSNAAIYVPIPAGTFASVLANRAGPEQNAPISVAPFAMRATPVTNEEFRTFVVAHPEWQRSRIPETFADAGYLQRWQSALTPGPEAANDAPVTGISWFAAQAYCESEGARLPSWYEWEYVAAADATRADARSDPEWRARILAWYAQSSRVSLPAVGGSANYYGVRDMHGVVWEWVEDFNALMVSADSRNQGDPDKLQFCGAGAISLQDRDNYAVLMRIAMLSSLNAADTTNNLGFRCVRPAPGASQ